MMMMPKLSPLSVLSCINTVVGPPSCSTCRHVGRRLNKDDNICYRFSYHAPEIGEGGMDVFPLAKVVREQGECGPEGRFYKREYYSTKIVIGNVFPHSKPLE